MRFMTKARRLDDKLATWQGRITAAQPRWPVVILRLLETQAGFLVAGRAQGLARRATGGRRQTCRLDQRRRKLAVCQLGSRHRHVASVAKSAADQKSHLSAPADQAAGASTCRVFPRPIRPVERFVVTPGKEERGCSTARRRAAIRCRPSLPSSSWVWQAGALSRVFKYGLVLNAELIAGAV